MPEHLLQYDSLSAMLDVIDTTRQGGHWTRYGAQHSSIDGTWEYSASLEETIQKARTLQGHEAAIAAMNTLAASLALEVPMPESVRRVPTWGRKGHSLRVSKVLSGHLSTAWRTTTHAAVPTHGRILTLIVPGSFLFTVRPQQIAWTMAASLAYALLADRAGYRLEIWSAIAGSHRYASGADSLLMTRLKTLQSPWNMQAMAVAADPAYYRRLGWRVLEHSTQIHGPIREGYGRTKDRPALQGSVARWASTRGINPETLIYGAHQDDEIQGEASARTWLAHALKALG